MAMSPARIRPETALEAAGYVRVSRKVQAEGHSSEIQREAIKKLAAQEGYALTMIEEDHERGSKVSREGYQRIIEAVRQGTIHVVICYMHDRWGRDGVEWLDRAREFDRLGVPIISVQEGRDEGGLMRFVRAGMAQWYSEQLAKRVRPAREKAAREGTHMGPAPLGYRRAFPAWDGSGRRPHGHLVPDEATAWIIREIYTRYDAGGWSTRLLAKWLNTDERIPPPPTGSRWYGSTISDILRNEAYKGAVGYNKRPKGLYERAGDDEAFVIEGTHEPLVDPALWERVQRRLDGARDGQTYNRTQTPSGRQIALGAGLFRCADGECNGPMYAHVPSNPAKPAHYDCTRRKNGWPCKSRAYKADIAHEALVREVCRLRGAPWTRQAEDRLVGSDGRDAAAAAAAIQRALDHEHERMRRHARRMSDLEYDPTPEEIAAFREVGAEISARIRALEAQKAETSQRAAVVPDLRALHERFTQTEIATVVNRLIEKDDTAALRELLQGLVASARVVDRQPFYHPVWVQLAVTWKPNVQLLLDAGLLTLAEAAPPPAIPTSRDLMCARKKRYRQRQRAQEQGAPVPQ